MFSENHYVPILKWRMGEYQGLFRLAAKVKDWVTPLFEIPTEGWDFENEQPMKSLDDHLAPFGKRLKMKWDSRICFVDSPYLDGAAKVSTGLHHLEHLFDLAISEGCQPIPVVGLRRDPAYVNAVAAIAQKHELGACIRLGSDDFNTQLPSRLKAMLTKLRLSEKGVDIVIDLADGIVSSPTTQAMVWLSLLKQLPTPGKWNTLTIAGTAFPAVLNAAQFRPQGRAPRSEWTAYQHLMNTLPSGTRPPTFGDYATSHPQTAELDPRLLDPNAKIKYTVDDEWVIVVGTQVKRNGREQYRDLCKRIISAKPPYYAGAGYSWGDKYIHDCSTGTEGTGGTSTWPSVATNHHVTKAARGVATFHGSLPSP